MADHAGRKPYDVAAQQGRIVSVQINGQSYPIRSTLDQEYVTRLAAYVDERIKVVADATPSCDSVRVTVLAALNIGTHASRWTIQKLTQEALPLLKQTAAAISAVLAPEHRPKGLAPRA